MFHRLEKFHIMFYRKLLKTFPLQVKSLLDHAGNLHLSEYANVYVQHDIRSHAYITII